jgi:hypothetical protein
MSNVKGNPLSFNGEKGLDFDLGDCYSWDVITQIIAHLNLEIEGG